MLKKNWQKFLAILGMILLFVLILLTIFHFQHKPEEYFEEERDIQEPTPAVFQNYSSLLEADIRELIESKREALKAHLKHLKYYAVSEVSNDYTTEDDELYMALSESYLNELKDLVTDKLFEDLTLGIKEINIKPTISVASKLYVVPKNIFDNVIYNSSLDSYNMTEEELILKSATNDQIIANYRIKLCKDNKICPRDDLYVFQLEKIDEIWKIAKVK